MFEHSTCLAAASNLAPHLSGLAGCAADRAVSLFHALASRAARAPPGGAGAVWADLARLLLEALNAALAGGASRNPELLYALLQRQEVFAPWAQHEQLGGLAQNVLACIGWLGARLDADRLAVQERAQAWGAAEALARVRVHAEDWRGDGMRVFEQLRFTYAEEAQPHLFFLPAAWACVAQSGLPSPWLPSALALLPEDDIGALSVAVE